jgi:DNA-binding NtrC family response regulator
VAETLSSEGYAVEEAGSAKQTLAALSAGSRPAVILMTACGTPEMLANAERLGAYRILNKPVDMTELPALVQQSYDRRLASLGRH